MTDKALQSFKVFGGDIAPVSVVASCVVVSEDGICFLDEKGDTTARFPGSVSVVSADAERVLPVSAPTVAPVEMVMGEAVALNSEPRIVFNISLGGQGQCVDQMRLDRLIADAVAAVVPKGEAGSAPHNRLPDGTVHVSVNAHSVSAGLCGVLEKLRKDLPTDRRGECLTAILHFAGELAARDNAANPGADLIALAGLETAIYRMQNVMKAFPAQ